MKARWLVVVIVVAVAAIVIGVASSPMLAVERIDVRGAEETDVLGVLDDLDLGLGALLLWVDTGEVAEMIEAEPWVRAVRVQRLWPDTLSIEVVEREPIVWIEGVLGWMLVARDGTVLERAAAPQSALMRAGLALPDSEPGHRPTDPAWDEIVQLALVLSDDIGSTLTLEMRGPELWTVALGHEVRMGHLIDLADKGRALRAMLAEDVPGGAIIDVSSPLRPAILPIGAQLGVEVPESEG